VKLLLVMCFGLGRAGSVLALWGCPCPRLEPPGWLQELLAMPQSESPQPGSEASSAPRVSQTQVRQAGSFVLS
jgi:hypothetical protein